MSIKRVSVTTAKIGISVAILWYLVSKAIGDDSFAALRDGQKRWDLLAGATLAALASIAITFVRWYMLFRAVRVPGTMREAFRVGFLGYLFNFFSVGIIGGDVLKAVLLSRQHPGRRAPIVASVVFDRVIGLYALFVVSSVAFYFMDWKNIQVRNPSELAAVTKVCQVSVWLTIAGAIGFACLMVPAFTRGRFWSALFRLPKVGRAIHGLIESIHLYQKRLGLVFVTLIMSLAVHALSTVSVYLAALGLPGNEPSLGAHFVIVPISMLAGAIPLPGGMGPFEATLNFLYRSVSSVAVAEQQGFIVALAYRAITMIIAAIGLGYYLSSRREVSDVIKEVESADQPTPPEQKAPPAATTAGPTLHSLQEATT